jgi:hypothetical protein
MFSYRRWFPRVLVIDGITIAPAFVLGGYRHPQHQKRHEQFALQAWESEGGNPAALHLASQAYSSGQALGENLPGPSA